MEHERCMGRSAAVGWHAAVVAAGAVLLGACGYQSEYMRPASSSAIGPAPGAATVVFLRPSGMAFGLGVNILDDQGRFLGDLPARSRFSVQVPPGRHVFLSWAENVAVVRAELAAGRVYYVEVAPRMGALSARMQLFAITPGSERWGHRRQWLDETAALDPDQEAGAAHYARRKADVDEHVRRARERLAKYTPEELAERTLAPDDGD